MNQFLLVGNAPYLNRGCEAIVRGTMKILRKSFGDDVLVTNASFGPRPVLEEQAKNEKDPAITNVHLDGETSNHWKCRPSRLLIRKPQWSLTSDLSHT